MINRWIRYFPVLDLLSGRQDGPVLEVGSGSIGMGEFVPKRFVGCDIAFENRELSPSIMPVIASGMQLPFPDESFGTVLCLDTLEHVPRKDRSALIMELIRVSRTTVVFACPMGELAESTDKALHRWYEKRNVRAPVWLEEHIALIEEFPRIDEFVGMLAPQGLSYSIRKGVAATAHALISRLEDTRVTGRMLRWLSKTPWRHLLRPILSALVLSGTYRTYIIVTK